MKYKFSEICLLKPQIGVVFNPITDELFSAVRGQGAFLNGKTLIPSKETGEFQ